MARRSVTNDNTSSHQHHKSVKITSVAHQEMPSRKRVRTSSQKSGSSKSKAQIVENSDSPCEIESIKKLSSKERMPEEFRRVKGKRGLLEWLAKEVPFDVILEIFCYAEPGDLLRLSRTSRDLRTILMSRRCEYIWRSARENVDGLPPLPDDLNEPQYAHLLFDAYCYICKRKGCENILWTFRARVCLKCAISLEHNEKYLSRQPLEYRNLGILPSEYVQIGRERILVGSNKYARKFETEFRLMKTEYEREEWVTQKQKELEAIQEHAILCIQWRESTLSNRSKELDALQKERKQNIIARLSTLGWGREALLMDKKYQSNFSDHRLVRQPKALTDRDWKRMRGELLNLLSRHRQYRQRKEWSDSLVKLYACAAKIYIGIRDTLDPRQPLPAIGDVLISMNLSDHFDQYLPPLADVSSMISEWLPDGIAKWRPEKTQELIDLLENSGATVCKPDAATSVFECKARGCGEVLLYPEMFYHVCCLPNQAPDPYGGNYPKPYRWRKSYGGPWTSKSILFTRKISRVSKKVVEACGLDPATATVQDLYDANPLIECTNCACPDGSRYFTWWPLILSHTPSHSIIVHTSASATLKSEIAATLPSYDESLSCSHCHSTIPKDSIRSHLEAAHSINLAERKSPLVLDLQAIQEHWYFPLLQEPSVCLFRPGHYKVEASQLA